MDAFGGISVIFAPHIDDEVLGCFAFLGPSAHVVFAGVEDRPSVDVRQRELDASASALGFGHSCLDHPVNAYRSAELIADFEEAIAKHEPATVLIPEPSYNQDHRSVYDAAIVATRPHDANHRVDRVLVYEQADSVVWRHGSTEMPNVFVPIDIDEKIAAYERYESQVRGHRSPQTVRALATMRGAQIGVAAAEAFHLRRLVVTAPQQASR